jgi:TRAP-type C4-dicarboxylate transport system substrate-binding protein
MEIIRGSRKNRYLTRVNIFLIVVALIAGIVGCTGESYVLTISSTPGGSVTAPGEGMFTYGEGTTVNLTAEAEDGYRFIGWTGNVSTIDDVYAATTTITMNGDYSITAEFVMQYELTTSSTAGGSVTDPGEGVYTYDEGEVVDLVATADVGYGFANWTGDVSTVNDVNDATTTITMNDDYSITANFEPLVWDFTITLTCHLTVPSALSPLAQNVFSPWIGELEAITGTYGGNFDVNVTYGDDPFSAAASLADISMGTVDIGQLSPETFNLGGAGYLPWKFPSIESVAYTTYHLWTENDAEWDAFGELSGVKILITAPLWGSQLWSTTESGNMTVVGDWTGVKVRTDAQAVDADSILSMGAIPVYLGISELAGALDIGVIDACLFTYYGIDSAIGLGGSTEYTTELNMVYKPYALAMNKDSYDALPPEARAALDSVCGVDKSVDFAAAHLAGESGYEADTETDRHIYVPTPSEMDDYEAAVANVDDWWAGNMTVLGFDGAGIMDRIDELIAAAL